MDIELPERPPIWRILVMACLPCLLPPLCTSERKQEYRKTPRSAIFILSLVQVSCYYRFPVDLLSYDQIIMFTVSLGLGGFAPPKENWLLGPTTESLVTLGAKDAAKMRYDYQVWRFFTPIFLHAGVVELAINLFGQMRMGLYLERKWKWYLFATIYILSGMGGVALGCDLQPNQVSVSASSAFQGVMGAYFAQLHLTWFKIEGWQKRMNLTVCLLFISATFLESLGSNNVDVSGHFGGLLIGIILGYSFFGLQFARRWSPRKARAVPVFGIFLLLAFFASTIACFYTVIHPHTSPDS